MKKPFGYVKFKYDTVSDWYYDGKGLKIWFCGKLWNIRRLYQDTNSINKEKLTIFWVTFSFVLWENFEYSTKYKWEVDGSDKEYTSLNDAIYSIVGDSMEWKQIK